MFPFNDMQPSARGRSDSAFVKVSFIPSAKPVHPKLLIEKWHEPEE